MPDQSAHAIVRGLAEHLKSAPIRGPLRRELDLERALIPLIRTYLAKEVNVSEAELADGLYAHGETRAEKARWSKSKATQNVVVFGCKNTSDIFLDHPKLRSLYIEVKLSRKRSRTSSTLPGDLQRAIGQAVIASLSHDHVICFVGSKVPFRQVDGDKGITLAQLLWDQHRVGLVVRNV